MLITDFLKIVTLLSVLSIGSLASNSKSISKLAAGFRKILRLFSCKSGEELASNSKPRSDKPSEKLKSSLEDLENSISRINWIFRLSLQKVLLYSRLWPKYHHLLIRLSSYKAHKGLNKRIIQRIDALFRRIMKSDCLVDKIKALKAADPFLNDKSAMDLIESDYPGLVDFPAVIELLTIYEVKPSNKNFENAKALLSTKYDLTNILVVDLSIWFFLTQDAHCGFFGKFHDLLNQTVSWVLEYQIILRADVDLNILFESIYRNHRYYPHDILFQWYRYLVKKSPFKDTQIYGLEHDWESISELLLFEDPKLISDMLDASIANNYEGKRNYLLLFQEDRMQQLKRLKPTTLTEIYLCFSLGLNISSLDYKYDIFQKISRERRAALASYLAGIPKTPLLYHDLIELQQKLSYLELGLFIKENGSKLNTEYARKAITNSKTLELLDIIGVALIDVGTDRYILKSFNQHLLANYNWDKAVEEHFHYYISFQILSNCEALSKNLGEYLGISIEIDDYKIMSVMEQCKAIYVDHTLDKIPRYLNSYLEIIDNQVRLEISATKRLKIAIWGSMFGNETGDAIYKRNFVHYTLKKASYMKFAGFTDLARIYYKDTSRNTDEIRTLLCFERLMRNYFPSLARINLEQTFQKILAKDNFSIAFKKLITGNFYQYGVPPILDELNVLIKEMFKYNPQIAMRLDLKRIPIKTLLKAIYQALNDPGADLRVAFTKYLFNAQLLHASLA